MALHSGDELVKQEGDGGASASGSTVGERGPGWRRPGTLFLLFLGIYGIVGMLAVSSRGIPWDEPIQQEYGRAVLTWYSSGFENRTAVDPDRWNLYLYGAAVEAPLELVEGIVGGDPFYVRHVLLVLLTLFGVAGSYLLAGRLGGAWVGLLAAVLLALSPRFFGHGSFNSKDIPFLVFYVWSLFLLAKDLDREVGSSLWPSVPLGLMVGLLMGIRVGGGIIFIPFLAGFAAKWWVSGRGFRNLVSLGVRFSFVLLISWGVMLLFWPWAQGAPVLNPLIALTAFSDFSFAWWELFQGEFVSIPDLPLYYLPLWLFQTLPEAILIGLALFVSLLFLGRFPAKRLLDPAVLATLVALGFPLVWVALSGTNLYDGARHLFFIQPLLSIGAAVGILGATSRLPRRPGLMIFGLVGVVGMITVVDAARLFPYEHVYFNRISGGLPAAEGKFELDYWGLSYREGAEWMNENLTASEEIKIASCSWPESTSHFLSDDFKYVGSFFFGAEEPPDFFMYTAPHDCGHWIPTGEVVHEVKRSGVSLLTIVRTIPGPPGSQGGL
jgi:hypothetical protein